MDATLLAYKHATLKGSIGGQGMFHDFWQMFWMPTATTRTVIRNVRSWPLVIGYLAFVGLLRGLLESVFILLKAGQFVTTLTQWYAFESYLVTGSLFLLANIVTSYVRWVMFAFVPYFVGKLLGGKGTFEQFLRVYAVAMGIYVVTIIPDFLYLLWPLPTIRFSVSSVYNPVFGVGQVLTSVWLTYFGYVSVRVIHGLGRFDAFQAGAALILTNVGLLVAGALIFFNIPSIDHLTHDQMIVAATGVFTVVAGAGGFLLWRYGRRLDRPMTPTIPLEHREVK